MTSVLEENFKIDFYPIQHMTPADILILEAFLFALSQQTRELPREIETKINEIARSLETRMTDLHNLAIATPTLEQPYRQGRKKLVAIATERTKGIPPNYRTKDNRTNEIANATPEIQEADIAANEILDRISQYYARGAEKLKQPNLVDKIKQWLNSD
ncbi:MAG: hypothetical protein J7647_18845 [Cyanobacteria bacterium SBLK]|nr:hypothetical protein [Cyanobacteria bacterium SBLK]